MGVFIGNGRIGKDRERGEFTCVSGVRSSVVDYALLDVRFGMDQLCPEVSNWAGSDHFPLKFGIELEANRPLVLATIEAISG